MRTSELIAQGTGDSRAQVDRYIRLTYLLPEILAMVDDSKIAFRPAVELSYLAEKEQPMARRFQEITEVYRQALSELARGDR